MTQSADWSLRVQDLTDQARRGYARSLTRYNELLARVAQGELKPDHVQKQFQQFLQDQSLASTRNLVELSVGLLTGLLHIESRYRDALLDGLLPPETPAPPPPDPASVDLATWFQTLSTYAATQSARSLARNQRLVDRVAAREVTAAQVQEHGRRFLERESPQMLADVMSLGLGFVERLQRSSTVLSDALYDRVLGPDTDGAGRPVPPVCIDFRGPSNAVASERVVVENTRATPADISCDVSDFAPRLGGGHVRSALTVTPARFTLAPGAQRTVDLSLPLSPSVFAPGQDYVATLVVHGAGDRAHVIQLLASVEAPGSAPSPPAERPAATASVPPLSATGARPARPAARPGARAARAATKTKRKARRA